MSNFEFGVGLFPTEPLPKMVQLAKVTEELGYSHIWVGDSHLIWREAYVNMAAMALSTARVKLGTGVTIHLWSPALMQRWKNTHRVARLSA